MRSGILIGGVMAIALAACSDDPAPPQYGANPELPEPRRGLLPRMEISAPTDWGNDLPTAPQGYRIVAIATDLRIPRQTLVLPNGDILVAEGSGGGDAPALRPKDFIAGYIKKQGKSSVKGGDRLTLLRDGDGDGTYETRGIFADTLNAPYGLALMNGALYVANQDALVRFDYRDGQTRASGPPTKITELPSAINHHWTKAMTAGADGRFLYVGIGSNSNITERGMDAEVDRARVWQIDAQTGAHRPYATGLRNPTALAIQPETGQLWAVVNERDEIGPNLVPDYLTSVREGGFYGWPYSYWVRTSIHARSRRMRSKSPRQSDRITVWDRTWRRLASHSPIRQWASASPTGCLSASTAAGTAACRSTTRWSSCRSATAGPPATRSISSPASCAMTARPVVDRSA